jgi:plastocyanin
MTGMMRDMQDTRHHKIRNRVIALFAVGALVFGLSACGGDDDDNTAANNEATSETSAGGATADGAVAVTIEDFAFDAKPVKAGETFKVTDNDDTTHTFTADDGSFDERVPGGETIEVTAPSAAGDVPFHCEIHKSMTGTLTVE